ncbi:thiol:disulfide interchange protein precursor [compost metagenome]
MMLAVALLWCTASSAQNRSINFTTASLKEAFKLAKEQRRMIFVDCYTVWCVPCKGMEKLVFTQDSVADFFNSHFINVKLDMEKGEGPEALKTYDVGAFPTYLLFDEEGKQIYKFVGGMPANEFMAKIRIGMNPKNDIATRDTRYAAGDRDHALLRELIKQKFKQKESKIGQALTAEYFGLMSPAEKVNRENWFLFGEGFDSQFISDIGSTNFNYLLAHYKDFVAKNGKEIVDNKINATFKKLAGNAMAGYYFKNQPYNRAEFEGFKKQINASQFPDKKQLIVLVDIAIAAGEKNVKAAGKLLAENVDKFTQKNMSVVFDYTNFCASLDRNYPYIKEIYEKVVKTSKNQFLISHLEAYIKRPAVSKPATNE